MFKKLITTTQRQIFQSSPNPKISLTNPLFPIPETRFFSNITASLNNSSSLSSILPRYGFSPSQLPDFVQKNEFLMHLSPSKIEKSLKLLLSLNPSHDFLVSVVSSCPMILQHGFLEKWQLVLLQLGVSDVTPIAFRNILEVSRRFGLSPDDVLKSVKGFKRLGFSEGTVVRVLEAMPMVIMSDRHEIRSKVEFLMGIGLKRKEIDRIFCLFPRISMFDVKNRLKPLLDEFGDLGFTLGEVRREVVRNPLAFGLENGELSQCLEMLRSLKCRVAVKENIFRNGEFRAGYNMKLRVDCLRKHGLTYRDAFTVLWKEPRVMLYEIEDIEKKIEFLVFMKFDILCLVEVPEYLGVNFDKQIVPRFKVIEHLRSTEGLGDEVHLSNIIKLSRLRFYNMYVKPYPECEKIYGRLSGDVKVQSRHPVGMWKLFRPQQYPMSGEDARNIKSYVGTLPSLKTSDLAI